MLYPDGEDELAQIPAHRVVDLGGQIRVRGPFGSDYVKVFAFSSQPTTLKNWVGQTGVTPNDSRFAELMCLVGVPTQGKTCPVNGIAAASFTLATYPATELTRP